MLIMFMFLCLLFVLTVCAYNLVRINRNLEKLIRYEEFIHNVEEVEE